MWEHPIKAIICDIDGLLLDTEPIFAEAMHEATGHPLSKEFHLRLLGRSGFEAASWIIEKYNLPYSEAEIVRRIDGALESLLGKAALMPGAVELLDQIKTHKIPIGLATGSNRVNFKFKTASHQNFFSQFDALICGDEVNHGKPHPEIFLGCMKKLEIESPQNCLVFEDAAAGVKCANNAGMAVVMVPDKDLPLKSALADYDAHPTVVLRSLADFDFSAFQFE
jgi:pseudouridine-5'-monophosphatase